MVRDHSEYLFPPDAFNTRSSYSKTSYWELAREINTNAPPQNHLLTRKGAFTLTGKQYQKKFHFTLNYWAKDSWELFLDAPQGGRAFSLHRNTLGLTYQNIKKQSLHQGSEQEIWELLAKNYWQEHIREVFEIKRKVLQQ